MAIYHFNAAIISRGKGQSAVAKAAYYARENLKSLDDGKNKNYAYKQNELLDKGIELPHNAPDWMKNRGHLWNSVETKENESKRFATAQLARRFIYAIPSELPQTEQIQLTKSIAEKLSSYGMVVDWAIHKPSKEGDERNTHAHLMTTLRDINQDGTFGIKNRTWNTKEFLVQMRKDVCDITNQFLKPYNVSVDYRSLEEQGIDREPTRHQGVRLSRIRRLQRAERENLNKWDIAIRHEVKAETELEKIQIKGDEKMKDNFVPTEEQKKKYADLADNTLTSILKNEVPVQPRANIPPKKIVREPKIAIFWNVDKYLEGKSITNISEGAKSIFTDIQTQTKNHERIIEFGVKENKPIEQLNYVSGYFQTLKEAGKEMQKNIFSEGVKSDQHYISHFKSLRDDYHRKNIQQSIAPDGAYNDGKYQALVDLDKIFNKAVDMFGNIEIQKLQVRQEQGQKPGRRR